MTFRTPLTSATAVDTGQPAGAGVRVYQTSDGQGTYGVVEMRDGIAGDSPSVITSRAFLTPQGGGGYTAQGGRLALKAGEFNATTGPELDLNVETAPDGGYRPYARLLNADFLARAAGPLVPGAAAGAFLFSSPWTTYDAINHASDPRFGGHGGLEVYLDAAGTIHLEGLVAVTASAAPGGVIGTLSAKYWPRKRLLRSGIASGSVLARVDVDDTNGQVSYQFGPTLAAGQYVSLNFSWPSAQL